MALKPVAPILTLFLALLSTVNYCLATEGIRFGVYPHLPPRDLEKVYAPIAEEFSRVLNMPVKFESSSSFENFNDRLDQDTFDVVFVQPFDFVLFLTAVLIFVIGLAFLHSATYPQSHKYNGLLPQSFLIRQQYSL